jgi:hypothetical protein
VKIAFICNCLEPGKDGVSDYATLLAGECERHGHPTRMLALNDPFVASTAAVEAGARFSSSLSWAVRIEKAADQIRKFAPDFVSLQFVCYGFHPRGIDLFLAARLREIIGSSPVQIMFHEIWIGTGREAGFKDRFMGAIQRYGILRILRALDVRVVHTSNAPYAASLRACGLAASILPLFGSVPQPPPGRALRRRGDTLVFGLFGTLHPVWPPEPLITNLIKTGKKIEIAHIGRIGHAGEALWEKLVRDYGRNIKIRRLGEQPLESIAEFFSSEIDFGISTTPWALTGKSATVASMLEHGLPVIVNRDDWHSTIEIPEQAFSPLLIRMDNSFFAKLSASRRSEPKAILPEIAAQFLRDLHNSIGSS